MKTKLRKPWKTVLPIFAAIVLAYFSYLGLEQLIINRSAVCSNNFDPLPCYENYYRELSEKKGIRVAFSDLKSRYQNEGIIKAYCHPFTHIIGHEAAEQYNDISDAFLYGDSFCWSGYYHGVMEGYVSKIGRANLIHNINGICEPLSARKPQSFDHYNCVHGLGHGVMELHNDELFKSLQICDSITDEWERKSCWGGAFMENIIKDNRGYQSKFLRPSDPLYPCNVIASKYKNTCYLMQTSYMMKIAQGDIDAVFKQCGEIEEAYRTSCYESLGRDISGRSINNARETAAGCTRGKTVLQRKHCIIGAARDFVAYYHSDKKAAPLCDSIQEMEIKLACNETVESYTNTLF